VTDGFQRPDTGTPPGPADERQEIDHLIDRLRAAAAMAQSAADIESLSLQLSGDAAQTLADDLLRAAEWLDVLVTTLEDEAVE
jgi:hypothetical protein